jgi:hypothetical protein
LEQVSFGLDDDGDEITTCVVEFSPDPVNAPSADAWRGLTALRQAIEVGLGINRKEITPFGMEGPLVEATQYELVRDEFFKAYSAEGDPDKKYETRKRAFNRQIKSARERHLICTREVGGEQVIWFGREPGPVNKSIPERALASGKRDGTGHPLGKIPSVPPPLNFVERGRRGDVD